MHGFQNRASDYKLLKFHGNQDNQAYLKKIDCQQKLVFQILYCHWIQSDETSLGVIADPDSEFRLALHAKRGKYFNYQFTDYIEKCDFFQTTSNIDILYTIGKNFHHEYEFKIVTSK